jgi:hypothetical protein
LTNPFAIGGERRPVMFAILLWTVVLLLAGAPSGAAAPVRVIMQVGPGGEFAGSLKQDRALAERLVRVSGFKRQ